MTGIIEKICSLEPTTSSEAINEIKKAAIQTTHMSVPYRCVIRGVCAHDLPGCSIPYYHVTSKVGLHDGGSTHVPSNWIRKFLIESIYRRLSKYIPLLPVGKEFHGITDTHSQLSLSPRPQTGPVPPMSKWPPHNSNQTQPFLTLFALGSSALVSRQPYEGRIFEVFQLLACRCGWNFPGCSI